MFIFIPANKNTSMLDHWFAANSDGIDTQNFLMITYNESPWAIS